MSDKEKDNSPEQQVPDDLERLADLVAGKLKDELLVDQIATDIIQSAAHDKMRDYVNSQTVNLRRALSQTQEWLRDLFYFVLVIGVWLVANAIVLDQRKAD